MTFRLFAPNARRVSVSVEGQPTALEMRRDEGGIWSVTTPALTPNIYGYSFNVDGAHVLGPLNTRTKPNLLNLSNSVEVPGAAPMPWDQTDIPHGQVHHHFYHSAIVGDDRDYHVYTPPGYNPAAQTTYPALYLLHGFSDDSSGWTAVGRANLILDSLIASNQAKPMIVVMPLGYGAPEIVTRNRGASEDPAVRQRNLTNFTASLLNEIIPAVERSYRVNTERNARAIAGLSMGGAESLLTGLNHTDQFAWIGSFSAGGAIEDFAAFPHAGPDMNKDLDLLWLACGTEDRLIDSNRKFVAWLKRARV